MAKPTEIEKELAAEIRLRKSIGNQAKYRKRGSRSKKCSLPCDNMTKRELKGMNGEIMTYNLGKPMKWNEFKYMPRDLQLEYLNALHTKHGASQKGVAEMFGISSGGLAGYLKRYDINVFPASGKRSAATEAKWQSFLAGNEKPVMVEYPQVQVEEAAKTEEQPVEQPVVLPTVKSTMRCDTSFCLNFTGKFDLMTFMEIVLKHIDEGQEVELRVCGTIHEG